MKKPLPTPIAIYANYADLPSTATPGTLATIQATQDVYQFVDTAGGDKIGLWLPADIANQVSGYVKDDKGNPMKLSPGSNGAGWGASGSRPEPPEPPKPEPSDPLSGWDDDPLEI